MSEKPKCSGTLCPFNRIGPASECKPIDECKYYMPVADMSGMESVIDMAMKQFNIDDPERQKLKILFDAYVSQYMATFCRVC